MSSNWTRPDRTGSHVSAHPGGPGSGWSLRVLAQEDRRSEPADRSRMSVLNPYFERKQEVAVLIYMLSWFEPVQFIRRF